MRYSFLLIFYFTVAHADCSLNLTSSLPNVPEIAERIGVDCLKSNRRNTDMNKACDCVSNLTEANISAGTMTSLVQKAIEEKNKSMGTIALMSISTDLNSLISEFGDYAERPPLGENCSLQSIREFECESEEETINSPSDFQSLADSFQASLDNNRRANNFEGSDYLTTELRKIEKCEIPDNVIYRLNSLVNKGRLSSIIGILNHKLNVDENNGARTLEELLFENLQNSGLSQSDVSNLRNLQMSIDEMPSVKNFLTNPRIFTKLKNTRNQSGEILPESVLSELNSSQFKVDLFNSFKSKCNKTMEKLKTSLCKPKGSISLEYSNFRNLVRDITQGKDNEVASNNSNLAFYCSNRPASNSSNELDEVLPTRLQSGNVNSLNSAVFVHYNKWVKEKKKSSVNLLTGESAKSLSMCDYIPQPGKAYNEEGVEEAIKKNCEGENGGEFTYMCLQARAVKALYGEKLKKIGDLEEKIRLAGPSPSPTKTIEVGGEEILVSKAIKLREQLAKDLFKEDMEKPSIVEEFITGKKSKRRDLQLAASTKDSTESNSGEGNTSTSPAVAKTSATSTAATYTGAQASAQPTENNSDYQRDFAAQTQRDRNTQELFNEVQRRIREGNQRANRELASISDQVRDIRSGVSSQTRSPISPFMKDVLDQSTRHIPENFYSSSNNNFEEEDYYPETDANGAPIFTDRPVNDGSPARERTAEEERERALEEMYAARAATGRRGGRSRGPASVRGSSSGGGSAPFAIQGGGISNLGEVEPTVLELKDDLDPNNLNIIDLANSSPESAERLLNLIEDNSVSSFVIKKGKLQVTVFRRGNRFVVRSDGANELAPGFRAFKQSIERSIAQDSVNALLAQLRSGIENSNSSQYQNFTNSF